MTDSRSSALSTSKRDPTGYSGLTDEVADLVDQICDEFEKAWRDSLSPSIEGFLERMPIDWRHVLLRELLLLEIPYRHRKGDQLSIEHYCKRFPEVDRTWMTSAVVSTMDGSQPPGLSATNRLELPSIPGYEILEEIGRGSMGVVYRAIQLGLGRVVAIKTLTSLARNRTELAARFRSEAEAVAKLHHAGIVQIYDVNYQGSVPYFSMEYIVGGSLGQLLKERPLHPRVAAKLVAHMAEAIHYAHQKGIVHRDLKPDNVLLLESNDQHGIRLATDSDSEVAKLDIGSSPTDSNLRKNAAWLPKITDFGLAKQVDSNSKITVDGTLLGTPSYMAPEQTGASNESVTRACDIYGLGAILYTALVGRPPFHAATVVDTIQLVRDVDPIPPSRIQPGVPRDLETICLKCLSKRPELRFATAQDLYDDLMRYLSHQPIRSRSISTLTRLRLWRQRNLAIANMLIGLVATLVLGICGTSWLWLRAAHSAKLLTQERDKVSHERTRAQQHLDRSRDAVDEMVSIGQILLSTPGKEKEGRDALQHLVEYCEGFLDDDSDDPIVRYQTAVACLRLGRVNNLLGHAQAADSAFQRSKELLDSLKDEFPQEAKYSIGLAHAMSHHANLLRSIGRSSEAGVIYQLAIQEWEQLIARGEPNGNRKMSLANTLANFVLVRNAQTDGPELKKLLQYGIQLVEDAIAKSPENRSWNVDYVVQLEALANLHLSLGEIDESEQILDKVMAVWEEISPSNAELGTRYRLALTHMLRAKLYKESNRFELSVGASRDAVAILADLADSPNSLQMYRDSQLDAIMALSSALDYGPNKEEIKKLRRQACQIAATIDQETDSKNVQSRIRYANTLLNCVVTLDPRVDSLEIDNCFKTALHKTGEALVLEPNNQLAQLERALALDDFGMHQFRQGNHSQAEVHVTQGLEIRDDVASLKAAVDDINYYRARSLANLSAIYRATNRFEQALHSSAKAIELVKPLAESQPKIFAYRILLMEQHLTSVGINRALDNQEQAWRAKLSAYLEHNAIMRLPNAPNINGEYPLFPPQLARESQKYQGAGEELAKNLLEDISKLNKLTDSKNLETKSRFSVVYRMSSSALIALNINHPILDLERRALRLEPNNAVYMNSLAWWLANSPTLEERELQAALDLSEKAVELNSNSPDFHNTLASIHIRMGNWGSASDHIAAAERMRNNNWFDSALSAIVKFHLGDRQPAEQLVQSAHQAQSSATPKIPESFVARRLLMELELLLASPSSNDSDSLTKN